MRFLDHFGHDPFNQNSNRSDREKRTTSKGGPIFSKLFRLDRTDPLSLGPKFPEILVEWIAPFDMLFKEVAKVWGEGMVIMLCVASELWSDFVVHINVRDKKNSK